MPCTTILVGKKASFDGSTMMARNEDSGPGHFMPKKFIVVTPEEQPRHYRSVISKVEIDLPDDPMRYTAMPNALEQEGIWGEVGFNTDNVAMSETETLTSNPRVLGADPLDPKGIGEEDMLTIVLPYIHSAREGVLRLGSLIEQYGTYEMNGIGFQDLDEIWWFESVGGHHWIAKRIPDDMYVVNPNQQGIDSFNFKDAYGEKKEHLCAPDMLSFIRDNFLDLSFEAGQPLAEREEFDVRAAFGSHSDSDHCYNTPRAWFMERYLNPKTYVWDGEEADFGPQSNDIPWSLVPEKKITIEDIKYVLSSYYQGTPYNPYDQHSDPKLHGMYRPIGINRNNFVAITQLRPYVPAEIAAVEWIAEGSNAFNGIIPFYGNINRTPEYLANADGTPSTENFYWANRYIGAMADAHFNDCIAAVERYQMKLNANGYRFLREFDHKYLCEKPADVPSFLESCNDEITAFLKKETYQLLDQVLFTSSSRMKNGFSRADG